MKTTRWTTIIAAALTLAVGACARNATFQPDGARREAGWNRGSVTLAVTNNHYNDMRIYAVTESGARFRIGTATGLSSTTFRVGSSLYPASVLRLVAVPLGGRGAAESGPLLISGSHVVTFTIQQHLANSFSMIR